MLWYAASANREACAHCPLLIEAVARFVCCSMLELFHCLAVVPSDNRRAAYYESHRNLSA